MQKHLFLTLWCFTALLLSACASIQHDVDNSFGGIRQAFSNFKPFDPQGQNSALAGTAAPVATNFAATPGSSVAGPNCPSVRIVTDLNQVHQFVDTMKPSAQQAISSIRMQGVETKCQMVKNNIAIDMTLAFEGKVGPRGRNQAGDKPSFAYPYFVAITNNQGSIIGKEVFAVTLAYDSGRSSETHLEEIRQMIPMADRDYKNYKVLIGFQLNDQELAYNRSLPPELLSPSNRENLVEPASGPQIRSQMNND